VNKLRLRRIAIQAVIASRRLSILVLHPFIFLLSLVGRKTPACRQGVRGKISRKNFYHIKKYYG
jgi:hypothetical protein